MLMESDRARASQRGEVVVGVGGSALRVSDYRIRINSGPYYFHPPRSQTAAYEMRLCPSDHSINGQTAYYRMSA